MSHRRLAKRNSGRREDRSQKQAVGGLPTPTKPAKPAFLPRWLLLGLCLLLAGGASWAVAEGLLFSKLPRELLGKWVVQGGPQDGATFDFSRGGSMVARLNHNGNIGIITAEASVDGKRLLTTTRQPSTGQVETSVSHIRELTQHSLVLESEAGEVTRMTRAE